MTPDARYVAFSSLAANLVAGDTNGVIDLFVRDRLLGTTERVSVSTGGAQSDNRLDYPSGSISADGRYVAFDSQATTLVPRDTNDTWDIFVRDRQNATTERISVSSAGEQGNGVVGGLAPSISADGRYVAFYSDSTNLVSGDTNGVGDIFVRDRLNGTTERVSVDSAGVQGDNLCYGSSISADGRWVAFCSLSGNLIPGDTGFWDVFVHDRQLGTTERVSVDSVGAQANGNSGTGAQSGSPGASWISADGRFVGFASDAMNLVPGDTNNLSDLFVRDRQLGTTERVNVSTGGAEANNDNAYGLSMSADGRFVTFSSRASNLVAGDTNGHMDVFVRDRQLGTTELVSHPSGTEESSNDSHPASISADGRWVGFSSLARNLAIPDTNHESDAFVVDRDPPGFASLCDPGIDGVVACPCSNPASGPGRGCDNSASTGGASLAASGGEYLSSDSLVFTTSGEKPTATSVVFQGTAVTSGGVVYGQGVRCVAGVLKRLYTKAASGGSINVPDLAAGDPSVHVRSGAVGNVIAAGSTRWYLVFYRDPIVLGGCPAVRTFNCTQTRAVLWQP